MSIQVAAETRTGRAPPNHDLAQRLAASAGRRRTTTAAVLAWMATRQRRNSFSVVPVPLTQLTGWRFAPESGNLVHDSGKFFTVEGVRVHTDYGPVARWSQPIIDQPERSILGILVREIDGVLHFLMQAKMEPGNAGTIQLSPTASTFIAPELRDVEEQALGTPVRLRDFRDDRQCGAG